MKRTLLHATLIRIPCLLFCACGSYIDENFLKFVFLADLLLPDSENYALHNRTAGEEMLKIEVTRVDFHAYAETFAAYRGDRTDIYYFGLQESTDLIAEMFPRRVVSRGGDKA